MVSGRDVLMFAAEMAVYVAVGAAGWAAAGLLGCLAAVVVMAVWWGLFYAPRAHRPAHGTARRLGVTAWFLVGVAAAAWVAVR